MVKYISLDYLRSVAGNPDREAFVVLFNRLENRDLYHKFSLFIWGKSAALSRDPLSAERDFLKIIEEMSVVERLFYGITD